MRTDTHIGIGNEISQRFISGSTLTEFMSWSEPYLGFMVSSGDDFVLRDGKWSDVSSGTEGKWLDY